jgi:hypothetical protein
VILVPTVVGYLVGAAAQSYLKWVACAVAFALALLGAAVAGPADDWTKWIVALVNGLVLFMAAVGANQLTAEKATARDVLAKPSRARQSWL